MDRKLKRWEMALMLGLLCALVGGSWLGQEQHELADSVIRFHVIANSDSAQDQALKLAVRDRVLELSLIHISPPIRKYGRRLFIRYFYSQDCFSLQLHV